MSGSASRSAIVIFGWRGFGSPTGRARRATTFAARCESTSWSIGMRSRVLVCFSIARKTKPRVRCLWPPRIDADRREVLLELVGQRLTRATLVLENQRSHRAERRSWQPFERAMAMAMGSSCRCNHARYPPDSATGTKMEGGGFTPTPGADRGPSPRARRSGCARAGNRTRESTTPCRGCDARRSSRTRGPYPWARCRGSRT